ncbi:MAG: cytochrome c5 family protein [Sulfuriflexus sp.]|nr:cytochrome c5 family protein [Sulfuriflexus sp.]
MKKTIIATAIMALSMAASAQAADLTAGKKTYDTACFACHGTGAAGAPKVGDKAAWKARIAQGMKVMVNNANKGFQGKKGFMPAKGGRANLSDAAVADAVAYMVDGSK